MSDVWREMWTRLRRRVAAVICFVLMVLASSSSLAGQARQGAIEFRWDGEHAWGRFVDGPIYVVAPPEGILFDEPSPRTLGRGDKTLNGVMINPLGPDGAQGWDSRDATNHGVFDDALVHRNWPVRLMPGDTMTVARAQLPTPEKTRFGLIAEYGTVFVVSETPAADAFAPPAIGWQDGQTREAVVLETSIDEFLDGLPQFATVADQRPGFDEIAHSLDRWVPHFGMRPGDPFFYQNLSPNGLSYDGKTPNAYGEFLGGTIQAAALALLDESFTRAQKRQIAARLVSMGIQLFETADATGVGYGPNGGHFQFHLVPVVLYLHLSGRGDEIDNFMNRSPGNFAQALIISDDDVANFRPHNSDTGPMTWRQRAISEISGRTISVTSAPSDPYWASFDGLIATNGQARAIVTETPGSQRNKGAYSVVLTSSRGFATGDTIWFEPPIEIKAGHLDWSINGELNHFNPSPAAQYRNQANWSGAVLFLQAAGLIRPSMEAIRDYVAASNLPQFPSINFDYPDSHNAFRRPGGGSLAWEARFWNTHWAKINRIRQQSD